MLTDKQAQAMEEIRRRLGDYSAKDMQKERNKLVQAWREAHPEAAAQPPSERHHPLMQVEAGAVDDKDRPEVWHSDIYQVLVRRYSEDPVFGTRGGMVQIGIHTLDGTARHDWREFQWVKNQMAGDECEAFELYPAESRLIDPSNYYTLWCFPGLKRIKVGVDDERRVFDADEAAAPQRGFSGYDSMWDVARKTVDEVMGPGEYARLNWNNPALPDAFRRKLRDEIAAELATELPKFVHEA